MFKFISLISLVVGLYFCSTKSNQDLNFDSESIRTEIRTMFNNYNQAVTREGLSGEFDYLDKSEDFFWVPPGYQSALLYDSVKAILLSNAKLIQSIQFETLELKVNPLSPTLANYTGLIKSSMTDISGIKTVSYILETGTVIKRRDGWKLLSGQSRIRE